MEMLSRINHASVRELHEWWRTPPDWVEADEHETFFDEVAYRLSQTPAEAQAFLQQYVYSTNLAHRRSALRFFTDKDHIFPEVRQILVDTLHEENLLLKNDALWVAIELAYFPFDKHEIEVLTQHEHERLAATAEIYLCYAFPEERDIRLHHCLKSSNPRKREYACDMVGDEGLQEFYDELKQLSNDPHHDVRAAATINAEFFE